MGQLNFCGWSDITCILHFSGSPREYLEHYIFPWLLPALEDMLRQAKKEKCLEVSMS